MTMKLALINGRVSLLLLETNARDDHAPRQVIPNRPAEHQQAGCQSWLSCTDLVFGLCMVHILAHCPGM